MKNCTQCGKCCIQYSDGGLSASAEEIDWWENYHPEIYQYVNNQKIWCDPTTGKQLSICPFLEQESHSESRPLKYTCSIYFDRPEDCRHYPVTIDQMIKDACEMIETHDLTNHTRAQQQLDKIMSDSRPAYGKQP